MCWICKAWVSGSFQLKTWDLDRAWFLQGFHVSGVGLCHQLRGQRHWRMEGLRPGRGLPRSDGEPRPDQRHRLEAIRAPRSPSETVIMYLNVTVYFSRHTYYVYIYIYIHICIYNNYIPPNKKYLKVDWRNQRTMPIGVRLF